MRDQRNVKGLSKFFEAKCNSCESLSGVKMCPIFEKKGPFGFYYGAIRVLFSNSTIKVLQKSLFRAKFGGKIVRNSHLGNAFPGEVKS